MIFKIARRELKQNILFFAALFFVVLIFVVAFYLGSRIVTSVPLLVGEMSVYRDVLKIEGGFLIASSILLCFSLLIAAYHALPAPFRQNLVVLHGQGAGEGEFYLLIFLQLTLFCLPALLFGIAAGELLTRFSLPFFIRLEIPLANPFQGIYITVFSLLLVMLLTSLFAGRFYFFGKRRRRKDKALHLATGDVVPKNRYLDIVAALPEIFCEDCAVVHEFALLAANLSRLLCTRRDAVTGSFPECSRTYRRGF